VLLLDEVHHVADWSGRLESQWDRLRRRRLPLHVVVSGSSARSIADAFIVVGLEMGEFTKRHPEYRPLLVTSPGRSAAPVADAPTITWQQFLLDGPAACTSSGSPSMPRERQD
jgi:hypothetical protein